MSRRVMAWLGLAALLAYAGWIGGPYLQSIILRDAAVTTWINIATAPIAGFIEADPLLPGARVGADGRLVRIDNPILDGTPLARAREGVTAAENRVAAAATRYSLLTQIVAARADAEARYADAFVRDIDSTIAGLTSHATLDQQRLALERLQSARAVQLARQGNGSQAVADLAVSRVTDLQREINQTETALARASVRRRAADHGVLLRDDGTEGGEPSRALQAARLDLADANTELVAAKTALAAAQAVAAAAAETDRRERSTVVTAPPGVMVWSLITAPGAAVQPGNPVASWVDCRDLLIDVPISDVEIGLLRPGDPANIVLEGERATRHGTVLLLRGAAATIGAVDIAAIAKGRHSGIGQALVQLHPDPADIAACPIGHAAYVDFPEVGLIDLIRARLRL